MKNYFSSKIKPNRRNYLDLLKEFIITDFKLRYKHSILGMVWVILKPLVTFSVLYLVWSNLMQTGENYALYLLIGVISIQLFNDGVLFGMQSLFNKGHIILKVNFPREVVVFSSIIIGVINFAVNLIVFGLFTHFGTLNLSILSIPLFLMALVTLLLLISGISLFTSVWSVRFYDLRHLIELTLQLVFWATPIFYDLAQLPENLQNIVSLNPLTTIIGSFRKALLDGSSINAESFTSLGVVFIAVSILTAVGYMYFRSKVISIAEYY